MEVFASWENGRTYEHSFPDGTGWPPTVIDTVIENVDDHGRPASMIVRFFADGHVTREPA